MTIRFDIDDILDGRTTWRDLVARLRLSADEEALFRGYLRRAGLQAREHIADHRAAVAAELLAKVPDVAPDPGDVLPAVVRPEQISDAIADRIRRLADDLDVEE